MLSQTERGILKQAAQNETAPGRLLAIADTPELRKLCGQGYIERGPYYTGGDRARLLKDIEAGIDAMPLLGAAGWWLTVRGQREADAIVRLEYRTGELVK